MEQPVRSAIILFAHGARDPEWAAPFEKLQRMVAEKKPGTPVELAYLELMPPSLDEAIDRVAAQGATRVTLVPLFMAQGGHLKRDLPAMLEEVRERHPAIALHVLPAIGDVDEILNSMAEWVCREHPK